MPHDLTAADLRSVAADLRKQRADLPDPLDAPTQREMVQRSAAIREIEGAYHQLERQADVVEKAEAELADLTDWRDRLRTASDTLREKLETELKILTNLTPPDDGPTKHRVQELEAALRCVDHFACRSCRGLFREDELQQQADDDGYSYLVCGNCGGDAIDPPAFRDSFGNCNAPPVLRDLLPAVDWDKAKGWRQVQRLIGLSTEKRDRALGKVRHLIEDAVKAAA